jgi:heat shock protein HtpX
MAEIAAKKHYALPWRQRLDKRQEEAFDQQADAAHQALARASSIGRTTIQFEVKATDFRSAAARNTRNTIFLLVALGILALTMGYVGGWGVEMLGGYHPVAAGPDERFSLIEIAYSRWGVYGTIGMGIVFLLALRWMLAEADNTILKLNGAVVADPQKNAVLHNVVEEVAIAAGLAKPVVYVIETEALNAFATGMRSDKAAVTVTRGLLNRLNREELQGVVAHELAHIGNGDVRLAVIVAMVVGLIAIVSDVLGRGARVGGRRMLRGRGDGKVAALVVPVWILFALLAPLFGLLVRMAISREREYLADATGARLTRNPIGLASALAKIANNPRVKNTSSALEHLWIASPKRSYGEASSALFSTHPPTSVRIERLLNLR